MGDFTTGYGITGALTQPYDLGPTTIKTVANGFIVTLSSILNASSETHVFESQASLFAFLKTQLKDPKK